MEFELEEGFGDGVGLRSEEFEALENLAGPEYELGDVGGGSEGCERVGHRWVVESVDYAAVDCTMIALSGKY